MSWVKTRRNRENVHVKQHLGWFEVRNQCLNWDVSEQQQHEATVLLSNFYDKHVLDKHWSSDHQTKLQYPPLHQLYISCRRVKDLCAPQHVCKGSSK